MLRGTAYLLIVVALVLAGCGAPPPPAPIDTGGPRIISLSPAVTRTLEDCGLAKYIVGRSSFCEFDAFEPTWLVQRVGDLQHIDYELILRLEPTHVFVQPTGGVDEELSLLAKEHDWAMHALVLETLDDIAEFVRRLPDRVVVDDAEIDTALRERCDERVAAIQALAEPLERPPLGNILICTDDDGDVLAWGAGTWYGDILVRCGGRNVAHHREWSVLSLEDVARLKPDGIIVLTHEASDDPPRLANVLTPARKAGRVVWFADPDVRRPCSSIVESGRRFRDLLAKWSIQ